MAAKKNPIPKSETAEVFIPRTDTSKDQNFFVGVNGISYILPRGKKSVVPVAVAKEVERSLAAETKMYEERAAMQAAAK